MTVVDHKPAPQTLAIRMRYRLATLALALTAWVSRRIDAFNERLFVSVVETAPDWTTLESWLVTHFRDRLGTEISFQEVEESAPKIVYPAHRVVC